MLFRSGLIAGDTIAGAFGFAGGLTGYFASKRSAEKSGKRYGLDLYGSLGIISIRAGLDPTVQICLSPQWNSAPWTPLELPGNPPRRSNDAANGALVADLLQAIELDRPPKSSGVDARWTLEMVHALYRSQRSGRREPLPAESREHPLAN